MAAFPLSLGYAIYLNYFKKDKEHKFIINLKKNEGLSLNFPLYQDALKPVAKNNLVDAHF